MKLNKEIESSLILSLIIIISVILMTTFAFGMESLKDNNDFWFYFLIYFIGVITLNIIARKIKNKIFKKIVFIFSFPFAILFVALQFTIPAISVFVHSMYYILLSIALPQLFVKTNEYFNLLEISKENKTFIILTFSIIIAVLFYKQILYLTYLFSPLRPKTSEKMKRFKLEELTEYIVNKQNIRFVIYFSFFVFLFVYSYQMLEKSSLFDTSLHDKSILQSFLCFLAFDRVLLNSKNIVLLPSIILKKVLTSIITEDKTDNEKSELTENEVIKNKVKRNY